MFPNGTVTTLANLSKQFANAVVEVRVLYSENLDRVFGTIREVGASMQADPEWTAVLVEPIEIPGVVVDRRRPRHNPVEVQDPAAQPGPGGQRIAAATARRAGRAAASGPTPAEICSSRRVLGDNRGE